MEEDFVVERVTIVCSALGFKNLHAFFIVEETEDVGHIGAAYSAIICGNIFIFLMFGCIGA